MSATHIDAALSDLGDVPHEYEHHQRLVTPGAGLSLPSAYLKWYEIRRPLVPIAQELIQESRDFLQEEVAASRLRIENQIGFVLLHRGDGASGRDSVLMLIVATWRHANELWQTVYTRDLVRGGDYQLLVNEGHVPTYCVWELAPVWHEQQAWVRYLSSQRDEEAKIAYLDDRFAGLV